MRQSILRRFFLWLDHPFHQWEVVKDTGVNRYEHCTTCGERRAYRHSSGGGHQPIDRQWVATGEWFSWHNLKPTAGSGTRIPSRINPGGMYGTSPIGKVSAQPPRPTPPAPPPRNEQHTADPRLMGRDTPTRQAWDSDGKQYFERVNESPDTRPLWPALYGEEAT